MNKKLVLGLLAAAVVAATLAVPLASSADADHRLTIGVRVDFVDESHAQGTFVACCADNDSGTATAHITSFSQKNDGTAAFEADEHFVGSQGSIDLALRGTTGPSGSPNHVAHGRWSVVDGTGAYAGLRGEGTFTAVTKLATGALTAINEGEAQG